MGLLNLSRLCLAVFSFSALIAPTLVFASDKPNYFYNASTKTWVPSADAVITPKGTIINNSAAAQAQRYLDAQGGFVNRSTVHANFPEIKKTVPITIDAKTPSSRVKLGAKNLLKGGVAGIALTVGLQKLLDGLDWVMQDGRVQRLEVTESLSDPSAIFTANDGLSYCPSGTAASVQSCMEAYIGPERWSSFKAEWRYSSSSSYVSFFIKSPFTNTPNYMRRSWMSSGTSLVTGSAYVPIDNSSIDLNVDSSYTPRLEDWDLLAPSLGPTTIEITDLPRLTSPPITKTIYDADGNPTQVSETNIWHDFNIGSNGSARPEINVKTTEETKVYENGTLTSTNTTTSTDEADADSSTSSGDDLEIPTDCDFMPTVCAFLDWVKNDDTPEEPDLSALIDDRDFTESYSISGGSKQCPPPYEFTVDFIGRTYGLSFEPACDFASKIYYFVMAAAYIFAAYITVGAARNG